MSTGRRRGAVCGFGGTVRPLEDDPAAAGLFVQTVRDGEDRPVLAGFAQRVEDAGFGQGVQTGCDFVEQQKLRIGCNGAGDGEKL